VRLFLPSRRRRAASASTPTGSARSSASPSATSDADPGLQELRLPVAIPMRKIADNSRGLVIVTDHRGGKSSTLAAMVDYINENRAEHF